MRRRDFLETTRGLLCSGVLGALPKCFFSRLGTASPTRAVAARRMGMEGSARAADATHRYGARAEFAAMVLWAKRKYKKLRTHFQKARHWIAIISHRCPELF